MNDEQEFEVSSREAEAGRTLAEQGRVVAEGGRVHAESNEETGRREAEVERVIAEADRRRVQTAYERELAKLQEDPAHYMTPGARSYFRRVTIGYVVLAIATVFGIWAFTNRVDDKIREDLNKVAEAQCLGSIPTLKKYNDFVDTQIEANREARKINAERGDTERVKLNTETIIRLQGNKLRVPSPRDCSAPLLK